MKKIGVRLGIIAAFLCLSLSSALHAQRGWEAGGLAGVSYYFGDLNTSFDLSEPGLALAIAARYNYNERICFRLTASYGYLSGSDVNSDNIYERARNLSFESRILEGSGQFEFNFLPYVHGSKKQFYTPYLLAGISVLNFNPMAEYDGELVELKPLGTEGQFLGEEYKTTVMALNYGFGFKVDLSYRWSINLELSGRKLFTDYLDDVSTAYPDYDDLEQLRGETAVALSNRAIPVDGVDLDELTSPGKQRGDSSDKDSFAFFRVGVMYYFGSLRCPEFSR